MASPQETAASSIDRPISFPRRWELFGVVLRNPLRQVAQLGHTRQLTMSAFNHGRTTSYRGVDVQGRITVFCSRPTKADIQCDELLLVTGTETLDALQNDLSNGMGRWVRPGPRAPESLEIAVAEAYCKNVVTTWRAKFEFREEQKPTDGPPTSGLRRPQIGALHAVLAHWSVDYKAATVVMPTGTGKTETMLALLVQAQIPRLLVVAPTSALRDQLVEKFLTLGMLFESTCLAPEISLPVVVSLEHRPESADEVDQIFRRANVVVSTMQVAGQCAPAVQGRMAALCSHLFIDEAHHIAARTWYDFKKHFDHLPVVQFTATPFRTDGKRVDGKFVYMYPLHRAQSEGYFQSINFLPVNEVGGPEADISIARAAGGRLNDDLAAGFDHVLMARVDTIKRAEDVFAIYSRELPHFQPVMIHSKTSKTQRRELLQLVHARTSRIIVCVDMFGEGFDFPELKVAALHDRHKSLAITLQFIGRFARTKTTIGEATIVANIADESISGALRNLYAEDADWNFLLRILSHGATDRARKRAEILAGFTESLPDIPLQTLFPRMSAVVYKTDCENWDPLKIEDVVTGTRLHAGPVINPEKHLAIYVTRDEEFVRWGAIKQIQNVDWNLHVLHWDADQKLLFINSSSKDFHQQIAEAVTGSKTLVSGESIFRALGNIRRLTLTNLGLSHAFGKNIRYTMFMGADIAEGLTDAQRGNKRKSNLFGLGFEDDEKVTMGCSFKGRLWSHKIAYDLSEWVDWCQHVGGKLLDSSISTDDVFANVIKARRLTERPALVPIMVDWPEGFVDQSEEAIELQIGAAKAWFYECETSIEDHRADGPLLFTVSVGPQKATFEALITETAPRFRQVSGETAYATMRGKTNELVHWFEGDPPIIYFANGDFLVFDELFELPQGKERRSFDLAKVATWDWTGVDIRKESQGDTKDSASIQRRVIERLLAGDFGEFDLVFDDDGSGEAADIVAIKRTDENIVVDLYHCKYSSDAQPGSRIDDLYAVCGQSQKCVRWREDARSLLKHLLHREAIRINSGRSSRFEKGDRPTVQRLLNAAKELGFDYRVHIVQPGISKQRLAAGQMDLLGATENYLQETYSISLDVIASA